MARVARSEGGKMSEIDLSVIIPSYSEEENLRILLPRLNKALDSLSLTKEVLVVDSITAMDNTRSVCDANNVKYINRENNNYYGDAVRTAIKYASGKHILFMDGDGSHSPEFIPKLAEFMGDNDVVIASRYVEGGSTDNPGSLIIMSKMVNILYSLILGLNCKDVSNSFKIYRADQLKKLQLRTNNFDIVEEILFKLKRNNKNLKIKEVPFRFEKRMFGTTKRNLFLFMLSYLFTLLRLRFGK